MIYTAPHSTVLFWGALHIITPDSDLLNSIQYLPQLPKEHIQRMLPIKAQSVIQTHI